MATTPNTGIPLIEHGEVNGDVTYKTGSQINDLHNQSIVEALQTAEPGSPAEGQAWIINGTPTGTNWGTDASANQVAHYYGGIWHYYTPLEGWSFYAKSDTLIWQFNGVSWQVYIAGDIPPNQTWQAFQDYDTPLSAVIGITPTDIIISGSGQIGTEFTYNNITGELTYTGQNAVFEASFSFVFTGGALTNGDAYLVRIYDTTNTEIIIQSGVYVSSNSTQLVSITGALLYTLDTNDVIIAQAQASTARTLNVAGGWFVHKMYNN